MSTAPAPSLAPSTVDEAVRLANADGELRLNSRSWTGTVTLLVDGVTYRIAVDRGQFSLVPATDGTDAAGAAGGGDITVSGTPEAWGKVLAAVPPSGYADVFGACNGGMAVQPAPRDAERHLAVRRLVDLLRHAINGIDPTPRVLAASRPHGTHDAAVGRYVHLDLGGVSYRVYYEEAGTGIPLLCQHTAGSDGRQWRHVLEDERITSRFRVISYDLPYHGKSVPPSGVAWWARPYALTREFLMSVPVTLAAVLGLDRPAFVGASVGGMLALDLARFHPESFRAVIACEGALYIGIGASDDDAHEVRDLGDGAAFHAASMMQSMSVTAPEAYRQETRFHYAQGAPGIFPGDIYYYSIDHDLRGQAHLLSHPDCQLYMLTGEYDAFTVPASIETAKEIPGVHFEVMAGLGHFPMSEDPDRFAEYLLRLLDRIAGA